MKSLRLVATDLDGTLMRSDGSLDERTMQALAAVQRAGLELVICTARPVRWVVPLAELTGGQGTAVCANGAIVWDFASASVVESALLEPAVTATVVDRLSTAFPAGGWAAEWIDRFVHDPDYQTNWPVPAGTPVLPKEELAAAPIAKLLFCVPGVSADALLARARELIGPLAEATHAGSHDALVEMSAPGVTKAAALARLCARRNVDAEDVIAFGDMPNDLAMLRWAGHAVAVANAHPDVLAIADEVTSSNDDAGVARVLERWLASAQPPPW